MTMMRAAARAPHGAAAAPLRLGARPHRAAIVISSSGARGGGEVSGGELQEKPEDLLERQSQLIQVVHQLQRLHFGAAADEPPAAGAGAALPPLSAWRSLEELAYWYEEVELDGGETPQRKRYNEWTRKGSSRWRGGAASNALWGGYEAVLAHVAARAAEMGRARGEGRPVHYKQAAQDLDEELGVGEMAQRGGRVVTVPDVLSFIWVERRLRGPKRGAWRAAIKAALAAGDAAALARFAEGWAALENLVASREAQKANAASEAASEAE